MEKMHFGEIAFHLAANFMVIFLVGFLGYKVIALSNRIMGLIF